MILDYYGSDIKFCLFKVDSTLKIMGLRVAEADAPIA